MTASDDSNTGENILVIITLVVFLCIYSPISIYQISRLYSCAYRKVNPVECLLKRHTSLSLVCCIAYCIQFIDLSLWSIVYTDWFSLKTEGTIIFLSQFIHLLMQFILAFFIVLRFWLLHFSVKYEMISSKDHWKKIINPDYIIAERKTQHKTYPYPYPGHRNDQISNSEWIMANKHKWGNLKFCLKTFGVVFIILFISICVAQILHTFYDSNAFLLIRMISSMITYGIFLLIWSLMLAIYCRTPSFYDHIYVKKELKHLFHVMVAFFFVYIIFAVLFGFSNDNVYDSAYFPEILLLFHCVAVGNLIAILVFTYLPLSNLQKFQQSGHQKNKNGAKSTMDITLNLYDVLKSEYGFSVFMKHLAHEFSTEVLLSVTEFTMFKKYLYDNVLKMVGFADRNQAMHTEMELEEIELDLDTSAATTRPNSTKLVAPKKRHKRSDIYSDAPYLVLPFNKLPKSSIVYNEELSNTEKCYLLYAKYIKPGCEYEINIGGGLRSNFRTMLDNKRKWMNEISRTMDIGTMAALFDQCNDVNVGLMSHSFIRFKRSNEWEKVVKAITTKQSIDMPLKEII